MIKVENSDHSTICSLLVLSCDAYSDLWLPFFRLMESYWPDCPYRQYLGTGNRSFEFSGVTTLGSSAGRDWSRCVLDYLRQIDTEYVLVMLDDFFLRSKVDTAKIEYCLAFACRCNAQQIRLIPRPRPTTKIAGERMIGICESGLRYRVSAQAALWHKQALVRLLKAGESAWEFEHNATIRSHEYPDEHYAVWKTVLPYQGFFAHHVVEKGCWLPHEKWIFARKSIGCDFSRRKTLGWRPTIQCHLAAFALRLISLLPASLSEKVRIKLRCFVQRLAPGLLGRLSGRSIARR